MKKPINYLSIVYTSIALLILSSSCNLFSDDDFGRDFDDDFIPGLALESNTAKIDNKGGSVVMSDGTTVIIPANAINGNSTVKVSKIDPKQIFSKSSMVYDIDFSIVPNSLSLEFQLAKGLTSNQVSIVCYDPETTSDFLNGFQPKYDYDSVTGIVTASITSIELEKSTNTLKSVYNEMMFKRWVVEWDENVEGSVENMLIEMPYYMQPGGTCVTTCATMLTKAYTPYKDRKNEFEISDFLKRLQIGKDDGVGPYTFLHSLIASFNSFTGAGVESEGFYLKGNLQSAIIAQLDQGHPVILRFNYPGIGNHAILILGYQKITSGSQRVSYNLIFHNPNISENMYSIESFDKLMSQKSSVVAYQIMYPTDPVHPKRALQTVGFPLNEDGYIRFKTASTNISLDYDMNSKTGYHWVTTSGKVVETIPDDFKNFELSLPLWNANKTSEANVELLISISHDDKVVYRKETPISLPVTTVPYWFKLELPPDEFYKKDGNKDYTMLLQLKDKSGTYLDGFLIKFEIEQTISAGFATFDLGVYGNSSYYRSYLGKETSGINENTHLVLSYRNIKLTKLGNIYTGNLPDDPDQFGIRTGTLKMEMKNKEIKSIKIDEKVLKISGNDTTITTISFDGNPFINSSEKDGSYIESTYNGILIYQYSAANTKFFDHFNYEYKRIDPIVGWDESSGALIIKYMNIETSSIKELNSSNGAVILQLHDKPFE